MKTLGILGSLLLQNPMVRCLGATEALMLLPRGACQEVPSKGVLNEWAGLLSGFPHKNSTPSLPTEPHTDPICQTKQQICTAPIYHPKTAATQSGQSNTFYCKQWKFPVFSFMRLVGCEIWYITGNIWVNDGNNSHSHSQIN